MNPQFDNPPFSQTDDTGLGSSMPGSTVEPTGEQSLASSLPSQLSDNKAVNSRTVSDPHQMDQLSRVSSGSSKDDNDDLEEEWINKAKTIVEHTRADPYEQSNQLSKMKATYLKTHYNKDIKLSEDEAR